MHLRIARRTAVSDMPARKENEKRDLECMGLLEESLNNLSMSPEIVNYIAKDEASESINQLLQMDSITELMKNQLNKLSNLLQTKDQQPHHLLKATRLEQGKVLCSKTHSFSHTPIISLATHPSSLFPHTHLVYPSTLVCILMLPVMLIFHILMSLSFSLVELLDRFRVYHQ